MDDKLFKHCHACGQELHDFPFTVGDKVRHMNGVEGVVDKIGSSVHVQFPEYRGQYDAGWFKTYPAGLTKI